VSTCRPDAVAEPAVATGLAEQAGVASCPSQRLLAVVDELTVQVDVVVVVHGDSSRVSVVTGVVTGVVMGV
jgi:hypothetical protein